MHLENTEKTDMTLALLEGSLLDLGAEFWALMVVIALFVIEAFQLGPHSFSQNAKTQRKQKKAGKSRQQASKHGGARKRHQIAPSLFQMIISSNAIYLGQRGALLYVGKGEGDIQLRPKPPTEENIGTKVFPPANELDNYVMADGDQAEENVLNQSMTLWSAKDRAGAKYVVFYSFRCPSTYAVQCIAETLRPYADRGLGVSVLYLEEDGEEESVEERFEHLDKAGITLERIV